MRVAASKHELLDDPVPDDGGCDDADLRAGAGGIIDVLFLSCSLSGLSGRTLLCRGCDAVWRRVLEERRDHLLSDLGFRFIDHSLELISPEALLFFNVFLDAFELKLLVVDFGSQTVEVGLVFSLKPLKLTPVFGFNALPVVRQLFANLLKVGRRFNGGTYGVRCRLGGLALLGLKPVEEEVDCIIRHLFRHFSPVADSVEHPAQLLSVLRIGQDGRVLDEVANLIKIRKLGEAFFENEHQSGVGHQVAPTFREAA